MKMTKSVLGLFVLSASLIMISCDSTNLNPEEESNVIAPAETFSKGKLGTNVVLNEDNGHYYEAVAAENLSWREAWQAAANTNSGVCTSYLATITSQEENDFISSTFPQATENGYWLGGNQLNTAPEPDQGWIWITGEPWVYTNWANGEPNNWGEEDALHFFPPAFGPNYEPGVWNDAVEGISSDAILGYVVEYECPAGKVVDKVTGSGHFDTGAEGEEELRTFSFTAHKFENGVVAGEYQLKSRSGEVTEHGDITCLSVSEDGSQAWLGGIIERNDPISTIEGSEITFLVEDNGSNNKFSDPDRLSLRAAFEPGGAAIICRDQLPLLGLNDVEKGNITIH